MLSIQDCLRYSKPMLLPEIGNEGQEKIKNAKVLVIGVGDLGCPILQYLATSGVGTIGLVDFVMWNSLIYTDKFYILKRM